jgi:hypothetical protein
MNNDWCGAYCRRKRTGEGCNTNTSQRDRFGEIVQEKESIVREAMHGSLLGPVFCAVPTVPTVPVPVPVPVPGQVIVTL